MNGDLEDPTAWLTLGFWRDIAQNTMAWAIEAVPKVLVVLVVTALLLRLLKWGCRWLAARALQRGAADQSHAAREYAKRIETLFGILRTVGVVTIWSLALMLVLMQIGVDVAPIIAGAGIIGLAVGFGAQELVRDVISGFFMLLENHLRKGDVAIINGTGGLVEDIGLRTIVLRDLSGVVHVFQNGKIQSLSNMTKEWSAMVFDIGVAYKEDTDVVSRLMLEVAEELERDPAFADKILEPMEMLGVDSFGDNAVVVKARLKTQPIEQWTVGREYRRRLKKVFDDQGIEIPFPHRTLYWGEASKPVEFAQPKQSGKDGEPVVQAIHRS